MSAKMQNVTPDPKKRSPGATHPGLDRLGPDLAARVSTRLNTIARDGQIQRIWDKDYTLWSNDPTEISDRLGWLTVHEAMAGSVGDLTAFAGQARDEGFESVALLGMGGSSLAPEVLAKSLAPTDPPMGLYVLDTTDPAVIAAFEGAADLSRTLFVAASKSGSTIETRSQLEYFWNKVPDPRQYIVVTDPGSQLAELGSERGFRRVFLNQPDIGGRYSALSYFGLVPAALVGVDVAGLLDGATAMAGTLGGSAPVTENPGAVLGAVLAEAALAGRDKATILVPDEIASFGTWAEQLIAESTGKNGTGIVPIESEQVGAPAAYGTDRLFIAIGEHDGIDALVAAGQPVFNIPFDGALQLGAEFLKWEMAVAVAGVILGINPFDQPNVQEAKDLTSEVLAGADFDASTPPGGEIMASITPGDYVALLAYIPRNSANEERLGRVRHAIRDRSKVATTVGFGPRFLHSTGQLHKGGPGSGVFFQIVGDDDADIPIPGQTVSFGELKHAQALGDLQALKSKGRRVARVTIEQLEEMTR